MSSEPFPFNLPIWRRAHREVSPDGTLVAEIDPALEISMSNPTSGTLRISNGLEVSRCSPSFIWSDDSRYLAASQWRYAFGLQLRQRVVVIDVRDRIVFASRAVGWLVQPRSFRENVFSVTAGTHQSFSANRELENPDGHDRLHATP